jgi:hypothetical protein
MTVAESGDRKSAADEKALNAFDRHERNGMENYLAAKQLYDNQLMAWNAARPKATRNKNLSLSEITTALNCLGPKPLPPYTQHGAPATRPCKGCRSTWLTLTRHSACLPPRAASS